MTEKRPARKRYPPIKVYCLPDERAEIETMARTTGRSVSSYLRVVGQGYTAPSLLDYERVQELVKINGDLGRLGGLLKLWLIDDTKLAGYDITQMSKLVVGVLEEVRTNQAAIRGVMAQIVTPLAAKPRGQQ